MYVIIIYLLWVSDCLTPNTIFFQQYHGKNKSNFNEMFHFVLANNSLRVTCRFPQTHFSDSKPISIWSYSLDACLVKKQQIQILLSLVWPNRGSNTWTTTLKVNTITIRHYTTDVVMITYLYLYMYRYNVASPN